MAFARFLKGTSALIGALAILSNSTVAFAQQDSHADEGHYWAQGYGDRDGYGEENLSLREKVDLLRRKVKYVFVIFHENESFDHYFGTFPGANGLFTAPKGATPAKDTASFTQKYLDTSLKTTTISPFLIPQAVTTSTGKVVPVYPADMYSVDHSHQGMANSMDINATTAVAANDRYAMDQEGLTTNASGAIVTKTGAAATGVTLAQKQAAEVAVSHIDCDTIPFMWGWAKNFVLFDNFRQTIVGPSTPNAIAIIAGQSGQTQWALHNSEGPVTTYASSTFQNVKGAAYAANAPAVSGNTNAFVPVVADPGPFPGSTLDKNKVTPPWNANDESAANPALDLTFASLPLSFMGKDIEKIIKADQSASTDLADIQEDIKVIKAHNPSVNWGWYQQGFNTNDLPDPYEAPGSDATATATPGPNSGYVLHHNGPQYFGYLADNSEVLGANMHGAKDFFTAVENRKLPRDGGVFYLRGGYNNNDGLVPVIPDPLVQHAFLGNDDHASYSDHQISEALAAKAISDIANSPYWAESAIIITYDETDGYYDHVSPEKRSTLSDGSQLAAGPRIPTILISPYAKTGLISHNYSEHGSVIKFIDELFGLTPLASLPNEKKGREMGETNLGQSQLGPTDDPSNDVGDMTEAFDYAILRGEKRPIEASVAAVPEEKIMSLPHLAKANFSKNGYTNGACKAIGVLPTDFQSWNAYEEGKPLDTYPVDVDPRATGSAALPTSGNWTP